MSEDQATIQSSRLAYGDELAEGYGLESGPCVVTRSLPEAELAVTEINVVRPFGQVTVPRPRQDAYIVVHHLVDLEGLEYWEDGRSLGTCKAQGGATTIHDLRREPAVLVDTPMHTLQWFVPRAAFSALADEANVPDIDELRHNPKVGVHDDVVRHMNIALMPALKASNQVNRIFVDHVTMAFAAHLAQTYGGMQDMQRLLKGGLAPWQVRRAKEMLAGDLTGGTPLADLAGACGLSRDHFARAFRQTTGLPPHAWLNKARVDRAMMLLRQHAPSLSEVALECGFVDQSHFTRVFLRRVGATPGVWRRMVSN
jgi:AraC family transcriptional regulator